LFFFCVLHSKIKNDSMKFKEMNLKEKKPHRRLDAFCRCKKRARGRRGSSSSTNEQSRSEREDLWPRRSLTVLKRQHLRINHHQGHPSATSQTASVIYSITARRDESLKGVKNRLCAQRRSLKVGSAKVGLVSVLPLTVIPISIPTPSPNRLLPTPRRIVPESLPVPLDLIGSFMNRNNYFTKPESCGKWRLMEVLHARFQSFEIGGCILVLNRW
jgi:hypothetical protein